LADCFVKVILREQKSIFAALFGLRRLSFKGINFLLFYLLFCEAVLKVFRDGDFVERKRAVLSGKLRSGTEQFYPFAIAAYL